MESFCRIILFGQLRVEQADRVLSRFRTQKTTALLACLAYHLHKAHTREELAERFWPDSDPRSSRASLNVAISSLRHQLEPPGVPAGSVLLADRFTLQLNSRSVSTDVGSFDQALLEAKCAASSLERAHRLTEAVACYSGTLLPELYDDWIYPERQRLQDACGAALRELSGYWRDQRDWERATDFARRAVELDSLSEESCAGLMTLLEEQGRREEAWRCYREFTERLRNALDESPSQALQEQAQAGKQKHQIAARPAETRLYTETISAPVLSNIPASGTLSVLLLEFTPRFRAGQ